MEEQAGPSAEASRPTELLDLPVCCLQHIVGFMDKRTMLQFFGASKGSQDEPGCALLVFTASKPNFMYSVQGRSMKPRPAMCSLLRCASDNSTDMKLTVAGQGQAPFKLLDSLHSLRLYPDARPTRSGPILGKPAPYTGITSLTLQGYVSSSFIPGVLADAFPNLNSFTATWRPDTSQPLVPVLQRGLSSVQHVEVTVGSTSDALKPAARQHIAQQLSHLPSLTSIGVDSQVFQAVPAAVLAKLKRLQLDVNRIPAAEDKTALQACSQLESLSLGQRTWVSIAWVQLLSQYVPSIQTLDVPVNMTDEHMLSLLALPHLISLTVTGLGRLSNDYSSAPDCRWKQLTFSESCSSDITKLPLHALDSPVQCSEFKLVLSDHAADLAAISAAKRHLLRCGGIKMESGELVIVIANTPSVYGDDYDYDDDYDDDDSPISKEQAAEVLTEWAPCLPVPDIITCYDCTEPILEDALEQLWPEVEVDWSMYEDDLADWQPGWLSD